MVLPLGILVTGEPVPNVRTARGPFATMIRETLGSAWEGPVVLLDAERGERPRAAELAALVVTGSPSSVTSRAPWILDTEAALAAFVEAGETLLERNERTLADLDAARKEKEQAAETIREVLAAAGLAPDADFTMSLAEAAAERAAAEEQARGLRATIEAGSDLDERIEAARNDLALARRLTSDLQPGRFLAFLLEEERSALADLGSLHFETPDTKRFPCLALAYAALGSGEAAPAVLNAANEVAVAEFLAGHIAFPRIAAVCDAVLEAHTARAGSGSLRDLREVLEVDAWARERARAWLADRDGGGA